MEFDKIKVEATNSITNAINVRKELNKTESNTRENINITDASNIIKISEKGYNVIEIKSSEKSEIVNNPLFVNTVRRAAKAIEEGLIVDSINFYTKNDLAKEENSSRVNNNDSEAYWESHCYYLGTYSGYKFLYLESCIAVSTNRVVPNNITPSFNWVNFIGKTVKSALGVWIDQRLSTGVTVITDLVSNILGAIDTPMSVSYSQAAAGYIETWVKGNWYIRDVYIQDKLDKVSGYAYYEWACMQQTRMQHALDVAIPVGQRTATTYDYRYYAGYGPVQTYSTPGYVNSQAFMSAVLSKYNSSVYGIMPYYEEIDIPSLLTYIIS